MILKECTPEEFLEYRLKKKEAQKKVFHGYLRENDVKDTLIHKWVKHYVDYQPLRHLTSYPFPHAQLNGKRRLDLNIPDSYFEFLKEVKINEEEAMICSRYIMFLCSDFYVYKYTNTPNYKEYEEREGMVAAIFNAMLETNEGFAREVLLTRFLFEMMEHKESLSAQVPPLMEKYYNTVKERSFVEAVMKKYNLRYDEKNEIKPAEHINLLDFEADEALLPGLVRRFAGKVIYIDIWATWCVPCLNEMEFYPKLIERYKDKDMVFVFLAAHSPENLWKTRINEYGLEGQHHLLNEKQYYALEKYFELGGFPQHVIVNRKGEVVESKGPRIYHLDGGLNEHLLEFLDGLLDK